MASQTADALPAVGSSAPFCLSLLGSFRLTGPHGETVDISSKKNRMLLAMVALAPGRSLSRDALASALWAEHGDDQARSSLRQALAVLRKELNGQQDIFFSSFDSTVSLNPEAITLDTDGFVSGIRVATREALERSVNLWRGPFLSDVTAPEPGLEQWLSERRAFFSRQYIVAMDLLAPHLEGAARIDLGRRLVEADNLREASHRQLMEAYRLAGEKAQALRHYEGLRKLLHDELGVEPSPETQALRNMIASGGRTPVAAPQPPAANAAAAPVDLPERPRRSRAWTFAAAILISAAAAAGWYAARPATEPVTIPSVAILPFESLSGSVEDARIATGLTIDTITDLSRYADFRVMAKDTSDTYKGKAVDIRTMGKDLKISHVLKGTYQRDKDHIRITAQLIDASTGEALWSDRYDRLAGEIFAVQSDVADHIANSLGGREGKVGKSLAASARNKPPADLGAYELYLTAQETMYSDLSAESMRKGQEILEQVIAKDPAFARAYVRYANAFAWRATYESGFVQLLQQMLSYARKAVALDPMDGDAQAALGYALTLTGDAKLGEVHLDEALRLTPNAFDVLIFHACLKHAYGKADQGAAASDRALAINPAYPNWAIPCMRLGVVLVGRYEDAVRIQSRQPENEMNTDGYVILAGSLAALGKKEEAAALVNRAVARFPGLLSIERFALNRGWPPGASKVMVDLMRRAGFPACATAQDLADTPNPVRLPECANAG